MNTRINDLVHILEKIGTPLMAAIGHTQNPNTSPADTAETMAALLARTIQLSINIGESAQISATDAEDDSIRVALAAMASPLIAEHYKNNGQVPEESLIQRTAASLDAVINFSKNFKLDAEMEERLGALDTGTLKDGAQAELLYIHAFIPVVQAISEFSFGQPETKLLSELTERINAHAQQLTQSLFDDLEDGTDIKTVELSVLKALAGIYANAHRAASNALKTATDDDQDVLGLDRAWQAFELQVSMLDALMSGVSGKEPDPAPSAQEPKQEPAETPAQSVSEVPDTKPEANEDEAPPPPPPLTPKQDTPPPKEPAKETPAPPSGGPMGFFAKKPADEPEDQPDDQKDDTPNNIYEDEPPPLEEDKSDNEAAEPEAPPKKPQQGSSNPMSFFKKDEDDEE